MHKRGITVLPGVDCGFAGTFHGTYARDLDQSVKLLGFNPTQYLIATTADAAKLFMHEDELANHKWGSVETVFWFYGNTLKDITVQDHGKLIIIVINCKLHKARRMENIAPPFVGQAHGITETMPEFPEAKKQMQKNY